MVFDRGLKRTRGAWLGKLGGLFRRSSIDDSLWDELEEILIGADVGIGTSTRLLAAIRARVKEGNVQQPAMVRNLLETEMVAILKASVPPTPATRDGAGPSVILVIGVNGTGKTTSIAKLAYSLQGKGKRVLLAAADTFRAAAIDQIKYWGDRIGLEVIAHQPGADPGAVVYDALEAAKKRASDVLIIDTAGRIQTKLNLMEELKKIRRVVARSEIEPEVMLVLDANTGQNGLSQARYFAEAVAVTGMFLAKLDSTAKGGIALAIADELRLPILYLGTGQQLDDMVPFSAEDFVKALLSS